MANPVSQEIVIWHYIGPKDDENARHNRQVRLDIVKAAVRKENPGCKITEFFVEATTSNQQLSLMDLMRSMYLKRYRVPDGFSLITRWANYYSGLLKYFLTAERAKSAEFTLLANHF